MAKDFIEKLKDNVLVVDALNLAFRWKHSKAEFFVEEYVNTVFSLARSYSCNKIIIAADKGSSSYRKALYPEYKGNRDELRKNQTEEEKDEFILFIEEYERCLKKLETFDRVILLRFDGVEADDIAGYIVKNKNLVKGDIWLISSDKDWDLLISDRVHRFSYVTRKEIDLNNWPYEVSPEELVSVKALMGDKGDNIIGVPSVGEKRAYSLVSQYGSALDIWEQLPIPSKYKYIQNLNEFGDKILLNLELVDLLTYCESALGTDNCEFIKTNLAKHMDS